jgi:hypothetical protein
VSQKAKSLSFETIARFREVYLLWQKVEHLVERLSEGDGFPSVDFKVRQMPKLGPILIATAFFIVGANAWAHDPPLFAVFKAFCIDTGANPAAVKSAIEAVGGKQHAAGATEQPFTMTVTSWDVTAGGASLNVSAGTQQASPAQNRAEENSNHCVVTSFVNDNASIEALHSWVGIPPDHVLRGNPTISFFNYQEQGSVRSTLPTSKSVYDMAKVEGRLWSLVVLQSQDGASVQLVHHLAPPIPR